jgi:hypothetical protein
VRLDHRRAIALYLVTLVAAVITLVDNGPAKADDRKGISRSFRTPTSSSPGIRTTAPAMSGNGAALSIRTQPA